MASVALRLFVVATGGEGTSPSVALLTHRVPQYGGGGVDAETPLQQLLVNCGECACRTLQEARVKLSALSHVCLTSLAPHALAGVPSLLFHLGDRGAGAVSLVTGRCSGGAGPLVSGGGGSGGGGGGLRELQGYYDTVRPFVARRYPEVTCCAMPPPSGGGGGGTGQPPPAECDVSVAACWAAMRARVPAAGISVVALPIRWVTAATVDHGRTAVSSGVDDEDEEEQEPTSGGGGAPREGPPPKRHRVNAATAAAAGRDHDDGDRGDGCACTCYLVTVTAPFVGGGVDSDSGTQRRVLLVDAGASVGRGLLSAAALAESLVAALPQSLRDSVGMVAHLDTAASDAARGGRATCIDGGYRRALAAAFSAAAHYIVGSGPGAPTGAPHFPAAASHAAVLAAVEPHLWPLGGAGTGPAAGAAGPSPGVIGGGSGHEGSPLPADVPPGGWAHLAALSSLDLVTGVVVAAAGVPSPSAVAAAALAARAAADVSGASGPFVLPAPLRRDLPLCVVTASGGDTNEIDLDGDGGATPLVAEEAAAPSRAVDVAAANPLAPPNLVFLGTGAAAPSKLRSCSGLLVSWEGGGEEDGGSCAGGGGGGACSGACSRLLLDCGEGALGRLRQLAACEGVAWGALLASIGAVSITHMHADHHSGLLAVLSARAAAAAAATAGAGATADGPQHHNPGPLTCRQHQPLLVLGPPALRSVLEGYARLIGAWRRPGGGGAPAAAAAAVAGIYTFVGPQPAAGGVQLARRLPWIGAWQRPPVAHCRDAVADVLTLLLTTPTTTTTPATAPTPPPPGAPVAAAAGAVCAPPPPPRMRSLVLAYSGDTRPCQALVAAIAHAAAAAAAASAAVAASGARLGFAGGVCAAAAAADAGPPSGGWRHTTPSHHPPLAPPHVAGAGAVRVLLVHEATMNDDRWRDAAAKRHSTVGEALGVAAMCRRALGPLSPSAVFVGSVLTHFSQRYPRAVTTAAAAGSRVAAVPAADEAGVACAGPHHPPPLPEEDAEEGWAGQQTAGSGGGARGGAAAAAAAAAAAQAHSTTSRGGDGGGGGGSDGGSDDGGRFLLAHDGLVVPLAAEGGLDALLLAGGAARRVAARVDAAWAAAANES